MRDRRPTDYRDFGFDVRRRVAGFVEGFSAGASELGGSDEVATEEAEISSAAAVPFASTEPIVSVVSGAREGGATEVELGSGGEGEGAPAGCSAVGGVPGAGVIGAGGADGAGTVGEGGGGLFTVLDGGAEGGEGGPRCGVDGGPRAGIGTNSPGLHVWGIRRIEGSLRNRSAWPQVRQIRVPRASSPRERIESEPPPSEPVLSSFTQTKSLAPQFEQTGGTEDTLAG